MWVEYIGLGVVREDGELEQFGAELVSMRLHWTQTAST